MNSYVALVARRIRESESDPYGWIIDTDHLADESSDEAGTMGPRLITPEIEQSLKAGEGRKFRMYDDDGELYYSGRILTPNDSEGGGQEDFGPLDDFGRPNAGVTEIRYHNAESDTWVTL